MHSPIIIPAEKSLGGIIINGAISFPQSDNPSEKRRIAIITKNPIKNLTVSIDNKMYPTVEYLNTSSRYSSNIVYTIEPDETVFKSTNKKIKLSADNEHVFVNIVPNPLKCSDKLTVIESLKNVYFNGTKDAKSIITAVLVWIEYNLAIGVDQIFINQSTFDKSHEFEMLFKLIKPYIETEKVVLVLYDTKFVRYSRQHTIINTCLYLNKGRTEWFATHDFDEFICPMNGEWKDNTNLVSILKSLQPNVNNIVTRMIRCDMTNGTYIKPTNIDVDYMKACPKYIVKDADVNVLWIHNPTNWETPIITDQEILRINHYREKNKQISDSVPYDGLSRECSYVENELNKKFGDYKNHIDKLLSDSL